LFARDDLQDRVGPGGRGQLLLGGKKRGRTPFCSDHKKGGERGGELFAELAGCKNIDSGKMGTGGKGGSIHSKGDGKKKREL